MGLLHFDLRFLTEKQFSIIQAIGYNEGIYALKVAKITDTTHKCVVDVLDELFSQKMVTYERTGRIKILKLTQKGKDYLHAVLKVHKVLEEKKDE